MRIGDARVSKADGSQSLDLQRDALWAESVDAGNVYHDVASGVRNDRPGLDSCVRALRTGDMLVVWKLDRLGRNLAHLVNTVQDLSARGVGTHAATASCCMAVRGSGSVAASSRASSSESASAASKSTNVTAATAAASSVAVLRCASATNQRSANTDAGAAPANC